MKILAICDSPTVQTGFARVSQNLLRRWHSFGAEVDVWGINFNGYPNHGLPYQIFPAAWGDDPAGFLNHEALTRLISRIKSGKYDVVWVMQDADVFNHPEFCKAFQMTVSQTGARSFFYCPVDAPLDPEWTNFISCVDVPVAYCDYGFNEICKIAPSIRPKLKSIPHGVDTEVYHPLEKRMGIRFEILPKTQGVLWCSPQELLLANVNANQKRKDPSQSLVILKWLKDWRVPVKLLMHMPARTNAGVDLEKVGAQLGVQYGVDWVHTGSLWEINQTRVAEEGLNQIYNAADVVISTSLGEGWGLAQVEAAATGAVVMSPRHTACLDVLNELHNNGYQGAKLLGLGRDPVVLPYDKNRVRYRVDAYEAALRIRAYYQREFSSREVVEVHAADKARVGLPDKVKELWSWDRIARVWWGMFGGKAV